MQDWIKTTNIYEVNLRQYTPEGTIQAFSAHLPRLRDMGVETLWFMPVTPISQQNRKGSMGSYYACSDYTSVALEFGSLEDFKTLVYQAHEMGFKVILDWVANHTQYHTVNGAEAWFTSNHDENSWNGTEYEKYGALAKLLAVFSCTWPGVPLIYSGQELPNYKRLQFFEKDVIEWKPECELHSFYRTLFALKKTNPALRTDASLKTLLVDNNRQLLVFLRQEDKAEVIIALNFSGSEQRFQLDDEKGAKKDLFSSEVRDLSQESTIPAHCFFVWVN
ncbi:MAG: DUF3459 domain-containing protein [Chitinophagaceae bacterium]|nr:MAG: DUF3459 domain-containing protein [Chitinophagaceae bacterium]